MNTKILIIIGITVLVIIAGSFWYAQNNENNKRDNQEIVDNEQVEVVGDIEKQEQVKNNQEQETENIETEQLSSEEIEKLKQDENLVWYEIPELGIKFLVTKDTKEDLRYSFRKNEKYKGISSVDLYSHNEVGESEYKYKCRITEDRWSCGRILLTSATKEYVKQYEIKYGRDLCNDLPNDDKIVYLDVNKLICFKYTMLGISYVINDSFYKERFYKEDNKSKTFGIYLNTIQSTK